LPAIKRSREKEEEEEEEEEEEQEQVNHSLRIIIILFETTFRKLRDPKYSYIDIS